MRCNSLMITPLLLPCRTIWAWDTSSSGTTAAGTTGRDPTMTPPRPRDWMKRPRLREVLEAVEAALVVLRLVVVRLLVIHFLGTVSGAKTRMTSTWVSRHHDVHLKYSHRLFDFLMEVPFTNNENALHKGLIAWPL